MLVFSLSLSLSLSLTWFYLMDLFMRTCSYSSSLFSVAGWAWSQRYFLHTICASTCIVRMAYRVIANARNLFSSMIRVHSTHTRLVTFNEECSVLDVVHKKAKLLGYDRSSSILFCAKAKPKKNWEHLKHSFFFRFVFFLVAINLIPISETHKRAICVTLNCSIRSCDDPNRHWWRWSQVLNEPKNTRTISARKKC